MSKRAAEENPIRLRWRDGVLIVATILLLSFALIAQAAPRETGVLLQGTIALVNGTDAYANALNGE